MATVAAEAKSEQPVRVVLGTMTFTGQTSKADAATMLKQFAASPLSLDVPEADSARLYCGGQTEVCIGELLKENSELQGMSLATKAWPYNDHTLSKAGTLAQAGESLSAFGKESVDIFYLHAPDANHPVEETLEAVQELYVAGKFKRFALSNYSAWEVVFIHNHMRERGWVLPTIYQGMYNGITRRVEARLFPALRRLGMSFYAYNPLAGGMLTGKYTRGGDPGAGRFTGSTPWGKVYQGRFMQDAQFDAVELVTKACAAADIAPAAAALRWIKHHSQLSGANGDAIIIGASKISHFESNMGALGEGPLPANVVEAFDAGWERCQLIAPAYDRGYSGSSL